MEKVSLEKRLELVLECDSSPYKSEYKSKAEILGYKDKVRVISKNYGEDRFGKLFELWGGNFKEKYGGTFKSPSDYTTNFARHVKSKINEHYDLVIKTILEKRLPDENQRFD